MGAGYSLYSTDSEDQVTTIHKGLDRCATLLNGMLQMEKTDVRRACTKRGKLVSSKPTPKFGKGDGKKKKPIKKTVIQAPKGPDPRNSSVFNGCLTTSTPTMISEKSNSVYSQPSQHTLEAGVLGLSDNYQQPGWATPAPIHMTCAHLPPGANSQHVVEDPGSQNPMPLTDEVSEFSGVSASDEDKMDSVDFIPVIDTSCQTSFEKQVPYYKVQNMSRHEAAKKVMTVKNLLGELKAIVADQIDCVALISEVEQSISMLPAMVGNTSIQAEVAQALQPLRSENAQLRRRLRIVNQQLMERERAEKEAQSVDCNFEMVSFHMANQSLQSQLKEMQQDIKALRKENRELQQRNLQLLQLTEDRGGEQIRQHGQLDNNSIRLDVDDTISEIKSCLPKLDVPAKENPSLSLGFQQKEAVVKQQVTRDMSRVTPEPPFEKNGPEPSLNLTSFLDLCEHQEKEACPSNPISDTINKFLNSLEANKSNSSPGAIYCSVGNAPHSDWNRKEVPRLTEDIFCLPKHQVILSEAEKDFGFILDREPQQGRTVYVPLKETQPSGDVRRLSPESMSHVMSLECSNKIQDGHSETNVAQSFERLHISEPPLVHVPLFDDLTGNFPAKVDMTYLSKALNNNIPPNATLPCEDNRMHRGRLSMLDKTFSSCDIKSVASNWSASSWSSFNTLDEQDFRNGLAALDASIASLQRTIQSDLNR